jgi:hypothetical protein
MSERQHTAADDEFPKALGAPATRALHNAGYDRLSQLPAVTTKELLALHGFGPKGLRILREALAARGETFADERPANR